MTSPGLPAWLAAQQLSLALTLTGLSRPRAGGTSNGLDLDDRLCDRDAGS